MTSIFNIEIMDIPSCFSFYWVIYGCYPQEQKTEYAKSAQFENGKFINQTTTVVHADVIKQVRNSFN